MLPLMIFPFLHMLNLDVHCETLGHKMEFVAKPFNQHTTMALNLFDPLIYFAESSVEVLNKLLVHTASAVGGKSKLSTVLCQ